MSFPQVTGYYGMTVNGYEGTTDVHGQVSRVIFAIHYPYQRNDVEFTISDGVTDFAARFSDNSTINLRNPKVLYTHKNAAAVSFEMDETFPANSPCYLVYRSETAWININDLGSQRPFAQNSISGFFGYTVDGHGGPDPDANGDVYRVLFSISFPHMRSNVVFEMSNDPSHWSAFMPDGTFIPLKNPLVLHTTRDSATVQFEMTSKYPSNSPAALIYASSEAWFNVNEVEEETPFIPLEQIKGIPLTVNAGIAVNLNLAATFVPVNATMQTIKWSIVSSGGTGAAINTNGVLTTVSVGTLTIRATVENGAGAGNYVQNFTIGVIQNTITITSQPNSIVDVIIGSITEKISTSAQVGVGSLSYQWYSNTTNSNTGGTAISGATDSAFNIPTALVRGDYFYFCEIRATGAVSVRTNVSTVRARPRLTGIEITPKTSTLGLSATRQLTANMIPSNADVVAVTWTSSNPERVSVDGTGLVTGHNSGTATIKATAAVGGHEDSFTITVADFIPVTSIIDTLESIETGANTSLTATVLPANATNRTITWSVVDAAGTGAFISGGVLKATTPGRIIIRATIINGAGLSTNFIRDLVIEVTAAFVPVTNISLLNIPASIYADDSVRLTYSLTPSDATFQIASFSVKTPGTTGATIVGDELRFTGAGSVIIRATVTNGATATTDYYKDFTLTILPAWVSVDLVTISPTEYDPMATNGAPVYLTAVVTPSNATKQEIVYTMTDASEAGAIFNSSDKSLRIAPTNLTEGMETAVVIQIKIVDGVARGVDYISQANITVVPLPPPEVFVPVTNIELSLPTPLRAWYPVLLNRSEIFPWNADEKNIYWTKKRAQEYMGADSVLFVPNPENPFNHLGKSPFFDWERPESYLFSYDPGKVNLFAEILKGIGVNPGDDYLQNWTLEYLPPYIAIKNISNVPLKIPCKTDIVLTGEIDTQGGTKYHNPTWDEELPSYPNIVWRLDSYHFDQVQYPNEAGAVIKNGNVIYADHPGVFTIQAAVENGNKESIKWYDLKQDGDSYTQLFTIEVVEEEVPYDYPLMTLTLQGGKEIEAFKLSEVDLCRSSLSSDSNITINGETFKKSQVRKIKFWELPELPPQTDIVVNGVVIDEEGNPVEGAELSFNPTDGISIMIPSEEEGKFDCVLETAGDYTITVKYPVVIEEGEEPEEPLEVSYEITFEEGDIAELTISPIEMNSVLGKAATEYMDPPDITSLSNFGRNFISLIEIDRIPETINGEGCLFNFLMGCTSFNQSIEVPEGITGDYCLKYFLRDCTSFNATVTLHEGIAGTGCMHGFMYGCTSFNQPFVIPESVTGASCLERFFMKCTSFNQPLLIPDAVSGDYCLRDFLTEGHSFNQPITLPTELDGAGNIRQMLRDANAMISPITVSADVADKADGNGQTFSSVFSESAMITNGLPIIGDGAEVLRGKIPNYLLGPPYRNLV